MGNILDGDTFSFSCAAEYRKKTTIRAVRMPFEFRVTTIEGAVLIGKAGDWLAMGVMGDRYPIDNAIFKKTYESVLNKNQRQLEFNEQLREVASDADTT